MDWIDITRETVEGIETVYPSEIAATFLSWSMPFMINLLC